MGVVIKTEEYKSVIFANDWNLDMPSLLTEGFNPNAMVTKIIDGPLGLKGKWIMRNVMPIFGPRIYALTQNATRALNDTTIENYPSRDEFQMPHHNVSWVVVQFFS